MHAVIYLCNSDQVLIILKRFEIIINLCVDYFLKLKILINYMKML